jgi:hypothetical protein
MLSSLMDRTSGNKVHANSCNQRRQGLKVDPYLPLYNCVPILIYGQALVNQDSFESLSSETAKLDIYRPKQIFSGKHGDPPRSNVQAQSAGDGQKEMDKKCCSEKKSTNRRPTRTPGHVRSPCPGPLPAAPPGGSRNRRARC